MIEYQYTNLEYLKQLSDDNCEFIADMIQTFLNQTPQFIEELNQAYQNENYAELKKLAHKMKPTFPMLGIENFGQDLLDLEQIGVIGSKNPRFYEIMARLSNILEVVYEELKIRISELK